MSLLIKALKKAELRHQEATAQAIEQVSADPTFQAAESATSKTSQAIKGTITPTKAFATDSADTLELQAEGALTFGSVTGLQVTPVTSPIALEAMHMALAQAHVDGSAPAGKSEPRLDPQMTLVVPEVEAQNTTTHLQPVQLPEPKMPAANLEPAADHSNHSTKESTSRVETAPIRGTARSVKTSDPLIRKHWPAWVKVAGLATFAFALAGAYLAWQLMAPTWSHQVSSVQGASPFPRVLDASPEQMGTAAKPGTLEDSNKASTAPLKKKAEDAPIDARRAIKLGAHKAEVKHSSSGIQGASVESLIAKVGPSLNLSGGSANVGDLSRRTLAETTSQTDIKAEAAAAPRSVVTATAAPVASAAAKPGPRLLRSDTGERVAQLLELAFMAVGKHDRRSARQLYEQVLELDRTNTDAMIALASLSARDGDSNTAERIYARILELDPSDSAARSGLASLRVTADPAGQESQLRHLLASNAAQPSLQFALGNSLAAQGRWNEAQQAYFQAFSADALHPDYAFNLAISLERVHQGNLALTYYRSAQELSKTRPARFDQEQLKIRILALEGRFKSQAVLTAPSEFPSAKD